MSRRSWHRRATWLLITLQGAIGWSCASTKIHERIHDESTGAAAFVDIGADLGLDRIRWRGKARHGKIITSVGGGMALGDYDGDGDLDIYFTQGVRRPKRLEEPENCGRLFRNDGHHGFVEATTTAGLTACGWGMGALFEDLDDDGDLDLFLTFAGPDELWVNIGDGRFEQRPLDGCETSGWHTGVAALDAEGDGDLDLYLAGYIATTSEIEHARPAFRLTLMEEYGPEADMLLENLGRGRFRAAEPSRFPAPLGRGLSVVAADFDRDGRPDLFVANDRDRNTMLSNLGDGAFEDLTDFGGVGRGLRGEEEAGMGVGVGDLDGNGFQDLVVTNFVGEPANLYLNQGDLVFEDASQAWGLYGSSFEHLGWTPAVGDLDQDGRLDLVVTNGNLLPPWIVRVATLFDERREALRATFLAPYRQPLQIFRGDDQALRPWGRETLVGLWRGGTAADLDSDGDLDLLLFSSERSTPTMVLRNDAATGHWLALAPPPGGPALLPGAEAIITANDTRRVVQRLSGGSFLTACHRPLHAGLADAEAAQVELSVAGEPNLVLRRLPTDRVVIVTWPGP